MRRLKLARFKISWLTWFIRGGGEVIFRKRRKDVSSGGGKGAGSQGSEREGDGERVGRIIIQTEKEDKNICRNKNGGSWEGIRIRWERTRVIIRDLLGYTIRHSLA